MARYGGEEFVIVLVETALDEAMDVAERIRAEVEVPHFGASDKPIAFTVSLGVTHSRGGDDNPEAALARADHALYQAKRAGRNQVQYVM